MFFSYAWQRRFASAALIAAALGYAIYQEWHQHVVSATETAAGQAMRATPGSVLFASNCPSRQFAIGEASRPAHS